MLIQTWSKPWLPRIISTECWDSFVDCPALFLGRLLVQPCNCQPLRNVLVSPHPCTTMEARGSEFPFAYRVHQISANILSRQLDESSRCQLDFWIFRVVRNGTGRYNQYKILQPRSRRKGQRFVLTVIAVHCFDFFCPFLFLFLMPNIPFPLLLFQNSINEIQIEPDINC